MVAPSLQSDGMTPLRQAACFGHAEVVRMLLDAGAIMEATVKVRVAWGAEQG